MALNIFSRGKDKAKEKDKDKNPETPGTVTCTHPLDRQEPVYGDPLEPKKVTALKCFQCGALLGLPKNRPNIGA